MYRGSLKGMGYDYPQLERDLLAVLDSLHGTLTESESEQVRHFVEYGEYGVALEPAPIGGASECETSTDTPSFGEFSTLPDQGGCPCPHSNHTSSSPSGNSSKPCFRKGTPTTRSGATDPESPSVWSSRS